MTNRPAWLDDTPEIRDLLEQLIERLDRRPAAERRQRLGITLNDRNLPALFSLGDEADQLWDLLRSLDDEYGILEIHQKKQLDPFAPEYKQARILLRENGETVLRDWLARPRALPRLEKWRRAVEQQADHFPGDVEKLMAHPITVTGLDEEAVVRGFRDVGRYQRQGLSLRQLSSQCFRGDSKFLDGREELLRALYPDLVITPRPVMVSIFIPERIEGILFIENQDSYLQGASGALEISRNLVLVYVAGFRASAARIRERDGASLHYHARSNLANQEQLEAWWFGQPAGVDWPVWFWGDLDYAGLGILKALKKRFTGLTAWQPGYAPMLAMLREGRGHGAQAAGKQAQTDPGITGCGYADHVLLPALRQHQRFVDQEGVF